MGIKGVKCPAPFIPNEEGELLQISQSYKTDPVRRYSRIAWGIAQALIQLEPDGWRRSIQKTPERVTKMLMEELCSGYYVDIAELFTAQFDEDYDGMVVVHNIPFYSLCEHHMLLIAGKVHVGYLPEAGQVLGLSKLPRVVEAFARRLQLQERLTKQIAEAIEEYLEPKGTIVVIEAEHMCLSVRGTQKPGTLTTTSAITGAFADPSTGAREEFFRLIGK